jgi:Rod binding domain-containing protein
MVAPLVLSAAANAALAGAGIVGNMAAGVAKGGAAAKAQAAAQDFEAVFLNSMFSQMFTETDGEGPFGAGGGNGVWRSFLTEEYSKSFAKAGGIGLASQVYQSLLAQQEAESGNGQAVPSQPRRGS